MYIPGNSVVFGLVTALVTGIGASARAEECLTDWGEAGAIVRREKLITVQQLSQPGPSQLPGQIVKTTLCKDGDDYIYKVVVREAGGKLKSMVVDARPSKGGSGDAGSTEKSR